MPSKQQLVDQLCGELASLDHAQQLTRKLAISHYENFIVASILLPRRLRQSFYNVYAFCRIADDLADQSPTTELATQRLANLREQMAAMFDGAPVCNLFVALLQTVREHNLPKTLFDRLLDAFEQDQQQVRYPDFAGLLGYCENSANPVGQLVLQMADCHTKTTGTLSDKICTGLQLANHWQDVAMDYQIGRIYLPQDAWLSHGVDETMFDQPTTPQPLRDLLREQCSIAESYLNAGLELASHVPHWLGADIKLFAHGGLETLRAIEKLDYNVLAKRPQVSRHRQVILVGRALMGWL